MQSRVIWLLAAVFALFTASRSIAAFVIDFAWWNEMGQLQTWQNLLLYRVLPPAGAALILFVCLWVAHARGMKHAETSLREHPGYGALATLVLLGVAILTALITIDGWTLVSYLGSQRATTASKWQDPTFGRSLGFYFFELPFYRQMLGFVTALVLLSGLVFWGTAKGWLAARSVRDWREQPPRLSLSDLELPGGGDSFLLRLLVALFLLFTAAGLFLDRFEFVFQEQRFLTGIDYVADHIQVPLIAFAAALVAVSGVLALIGRWRLAGVVFLLSFARVIPPPIAAALYVRPNELSLQTPYIQQHIEATRAAYRLNDSLTEVSFAAKLQTPINIEKNKPIFDNVRLWDWRAFHDTVTQLQALRQYYVFSDTDVDRYRIDGQLRQVLLSPRELDIQQLPDARANWINGHFIYTHGYGLVLAEANEITPNGQPVFFIKDAPPTVETDSLKVTRPELYFSEVGHEPVFVRTKEEEFNFPSGSKNEKNRYAGTGGIPVGNLGMRIAAAVSEADWNILLTGYLTGESRMLVRRNVRDRLQHLAPFVSWDVDPYLVLTPEGRMVWLVDGYTTSNRHPGSQRIRTEQLGRFNYARNSIKATVDAYDGTAKLYVFDTADPVILAFQAMFPSLFEKSESMPAELRVHTRYPEVLFRAQAEIYRTFHMRDPGSFYNKEDVWDVSKNVQGQGSTPEALPPNYVVATLPGETEPEFLLTLPFTPKNKDNLIGLMLARCDGEHLGEIVVLELSKQSLIYGPLQIEARIDSDQEISKDLSLWNQQGSQVLRGQMLTLPIDDTFLYVEALYLQSSQARMPQLKKVVIASGNTLIYKDTFEQALAELAARNGPGSAVPTLVAAPAATGNQVQQTAAPAKPVATEFRGEARNILRRYRDLAAQGKWSEAGKELEALERLVNR